MNLPMPSMLESKYKGLIYGINILEILCTIPCFVINACYGNDTLLYIACSFAIVIMVLGILGAAFKNTGILIVAGTLSILIALLEISVLFVMYNEFYFNNDYGSTALGTYIIRLELWTIWLRRLNFCWFGSVLLQTKKSFGDNEKWEYRNCLYL